MINIFNKLLKIIKKYYKYFNKNNIKIIKNTNIPYEFLISNYKSDYCCNNVIKYIKKCKKYIIIEYYNIKLNVFYINKKELDINKLIKVIFRAYILTKINNLNNNFNIYILLSPYKRFLPKNKIINACNINGGFTFINSNISSDIFISRKEEYPKVILHEIIHHINNINNNYWNEYNINKLKKYFKISKKNKLIPNEAIIELWATIYHILFISEEYNISYKLLLKKEIEFSLNQVKKLINFNKKKECWYEKTNAFCYIIFKTILLYNLKKFMKIYTYPYDINNITDFLIKNSKLPLNKNYINYKKYNRKNNSLCMMLFSDL